MTMKTNNFIFNFISYEIAWFSAILLASNNHNLLAVLVVSFIALVQVTWQYFVMMRTRGLWLMVAIFVITGTLVDTLLLKVGVIQFSANPFDNHFSPPWMSCIWLSFAITYYSAMSSFFKRYFLNSILCFIFFPIAYISGAALHAAHLPYGYTSAILIGIIWAILFPAILRIYHSHTLQD